MVIKSYGANAMDYQEFDNAIEQYNDLFYRKMINRN